GTPRLMWRYPWRWTWRREWRSRSASRELQREIRHHEAEGLSREEAALAIGIDFAEGRLGAGASKIESVESAIRTSVALLTEGVVAAPMEGITGWTWERTMTALSI
ncbi:MAG: hypothetical protein V9E95_04100, partial [Methanothrix soehngenii]